MQKLTNYLWAFTSFARSSSEHRNSEVTKKLSLLTVLVTVLSILGSCDGDWGGQENRVVASVTVSPGAWIANRGQQQQLTATALNVRGFPIPDMQFTWESSSTDVALVDADGNVTVLFLGGSTDVTATADGKVGVTTVTVEPVASVTVSPDTWNANRIGQRQQLTATAFDAIGDPLPGVQFAWESSSTDVSKVDANGNATAYSAGSADITATAEGEIGTTTTTVTSEIESDADGLMYTVWFARSDDAPALLVDGSLIVLSDMFCLKQTPKNQNVIRDWEVCPWDAEFSSFDYKLSLGEPDTAVNDKLGRYPNYPNPPNATTPWEYPEVDKFQWEGDRVGLLSDMSAGLGTLRVLDRHEEWFTVGVGNVADFQLDGNRIGIIDEKGALLARDNDLSPYPSFTCVPGTVCVQAFAWTPIEPSSVRQFQMYLDLIGVLLEDGTLRIRQGINGIPIAQEPPGPGVKEFAIELTTAFDPGCFEPLGDPPCIQIPTQTIAFRVGAVLDNGDLVVKDGIGDGTWTTLETGVRQFQLAGNFIGVLRENGIFRVKEGINGAWTSSVDEVKTFHMRKGVGPLARAAIRIGVVVDNGDFLLKQGVDSNWINLASGVLQMQLQGKFIGALFEDDSFGIWDSVNEQFRRTALGAGAADKVTQFRVVVDVPLPPARTTTNCNNDRVDCYSEQLDTCKTQGVAGKPGGCWPERSDWGVGDYKGPSPYYGRFAGARNPNSATKYDWWWALDPDRGTGPMDPMDALTVHHDAAYQCPCESSDFLTPTVNWYPENTGDTGGDTVGAKLCVVRYGLENAKLTRNGTIVAKIGDSTKADWRGLGKLYDVIYTDAKIGLFGNVDDPNNLSFWTGTAAGCPNTRNPITGEITSSGVAKFTEATRAKHNN